MEKPVNESVVLKEMAERNRVLSERYKDHLIGVRESLDRKGRKFDTVSESVLLSQLNELEQQHGGMSEATKAVNVGSFIQHGYDLIAAIYPNLVANVVAATQPLLYKSGEVWYMDLLYETEKGWVSANDVALGSKVGSRAKSRYSSEYVENDAAEAVDGIVTAFSGTLGTKLRTNAGDDYMVVVAPNERFTVDPTDPAVLVGSEGGSGTVNVTTGAWTVSCNTAPANGSGKVYAIGKVHFEDNADQVGRTKISLVSEPIYAQDHKLITDYTLDSEHDLQRNFNGMSVSDELIKQTAALIRAEIDTKVLLDIREAARLSGAASGSWDAAIPSGISEIDHFRSLITVLKTQSNGIYGATRMVHGNFIIAGNDISTVLEVLPHYKPNPNVGSELSLSGPYVAGTINGFIHIKCPEYEDNEWVVGNRGNTAFNTGYIVAPYRGLGVTPPTSDASNPFQITRGMWAQNGYKVVNSKFYSRGTASNI